MSEGTLEYSNAYRALMKLDDSQYHLSEINHLIKAAIGIQVRRNVYSKYMLVSEHDRLMEIKEERE